MVLTLQNTRAENRARYPSSECHSQIFSLENIASGGVLSGAIIKIKKKRNTTKNNLPTKFQGHSVSAPLAVDQCVFVLAYCFFGLQPFLPARRNADGAQKTSGASKIDVGS